MFPLRDIIVTSIVFGSLPWIIRSPYIGVLVWSWLGYMNPHRLCWGFAFNLPLAQVVALTLFSSLLLSKESKQIPLTGTTVIWLFFIFWMILTTVLSPDAAASSIQLQKVLKIQAVIFITLMIMGTKERINMLVWVIALSIGYFGVKGGLFTLRTGGGNRVWGPPSSFIEDNNCLALALLMILPLMYYLQLNTENKWIRRGLVFAMFLTSVSIIGSYSRGAFLAGFCVAFFLWLKSQQKAVLGFMLLMLIPMLLVFMPEGWHTRMDSIQNYEQDASAMGRLNAWTMTVNLASDRFFGGGFGTPWSQAMFDLYGYGKKAKAAHSIYFGVLGEHGWVGLLLFLAALFLGWRNGSWIIHHSRGHPEAKWISDLARMTQVSLIAYASGGAFLSLSYFDLPWHLMAVMVLGKQWLQQHLKQVHYTAPRFSPFPRPAKPALEAGKPVGSSSSIADGRS